MIDGTFIKVTLFPLKKPAYINANHICIANWVDYALNSEPHTKIIFVGGELINVAESPEVIISKIIHCGEDDYE